MVEIAAEAPAQAPTVGQLARVRGRFWVVGNVTRDPRRLRLTPAVGQLARVRGRFWVVGDVMRDSQASLDGRAVQHLVSLISVEDDATGEELEVVWEIESGTAVIERAELPVIAADRLDDPAELDAFPGAARWGR